ncbi:SWF or SNF family helicase [Streptomyces hilarionis]|uniref:SWF or SNF family helicase n=1 Tax=Streptomyces hilarionis TaxID=2839954 RepID=UPI00211A2559|nr:SWF or SNF family helicase [Streptomyces hilarionis]MCQ9133627.1 SWF or SNF family helicase [Streptomyces hilarionis]
MSGDDRRRDGHDDTEERIFAALPPAPGTAFARTRWGRAWLSALEDGALDGTQVRAGRRLARAGAVGAVSVRPGRVTAVVRDRDGTAHRADVLLDVFTDTQWDRFLDLAGERSGHVAALLDREMPPHLVEDAVTAGVGLLPGPGDLEAACDCGAWDHCGHTAAVCYQVARLLDQDPFVLLLLRGRAEGVLLHDLQARSVAAPAGRGPERADGVDAAEAYAAGDILPPLPAAPGPPPEPGRPPSLDTDAPAPAGLDPAALEILAARTAAEARLMLARALREDAGRDAPLAGRWTLAQDAVRLAAGVLGVLDAVDGPDAAVADRLAAGSGRDRRELASAVRAWTYGGAAALSVLDEEWSVEGDALARARAALDSAWEEDERPVLRARGNRWTAVGAARQLRLGRDGRWWPYREEDGRWTPAGEAADDPASAWAVVWPDGEEALS